MTEKKHLLIVDDDPKITSLMAKFLSAYDYEVATAANGEAMFKYLLNNEVDLIVLDIMMPGDDGFEVCKKLRKTSDIPVIMLTAAGEDAERILGLELGADDYLTKPFNPHELLARLKAILRRAGPDSEAKEKQTPTKLVFEGWTLDKLLRRLLSPEDVEVTLTDGEYRLLEALAERPQQVLSRDQLLEITQSRQAGPFDRSIDVRISRLRQKIEEDPKSPKIIKTVRSGGYVLSTKVEKHA
ncbi:MAG: DNA-binding response regulator [Legionellales bacterium]|nr:DNA-binding response regulator [Legionellales bacterium]|tara:strand:+ start:19096 stop:19818 length:723 start_codon:yes stop_codon:yes gene_type:complete